MTRTRRLLPALILATAFAAAPALAADADPIATSDAKAAPLTTAEQIDNYLKTSPAAQLPADGAAGLTSSSDEPRKVHGEVDVAVGSGGYRSAYARTDLPVGKTGTLSVAVGQTSFKGRFGPRGYQNMSLGLALGDAAIGSDNLKCRRLANGEFETRPMSMMDAGRSGFGADGARACRAAPPPAAD